MRLATLAPKSQARYLLVLGWLILAITEVQPLSAVRCALSSLKLGFCPQIQQTMDFAEKFSLSY